MKYLPIPFLALLLFLHPGLTRAQSTIVPDTTVLIHLLDTETGIFGDTYDMQGVCTGVIAAATRTTELIVTARHCLTTSAERDDQDGIVGVVQMRPQFVTFFNGDRGQILQVGTSDTSDLGALIVHSMRAHSSATFVLRDPGAGAVVVILGHPLEHYWTLSHGRTTHFATMLPGDTPFPARILHCDTCNRGDSGAGVYDAASGDVIGIVVAKDTGVRERHFYIPSKAVVDYLHLFLGQK
jgi:hypothetical protein